MHKGLVELLNRKAQYAHMPMLSLWVSGHAELA
jgi:hypothetical protein